MLIRDEKYYSQRKKFLDDNSARNELARNLKRATEQALQEGMQQGMQQGLAQGLIDRIRFSERVLKRPLTAEEDLKQLSLDDLRSQAESLEQQVLDR